MPAQRKNAQEPADRCAKRRVSPRRDRRHETETCRSRIAGGFDSFGVDLSNRSNKSKFSSREHWRIHSDVDDDDTGKRGAHTSLKDYVDIAYMDPTPLDEFGKPSRRVVSCGIFIYPQREGRSTDLVDDPAYAKRLAMYVNGLRRVVELTKDHLPGYHVRLYVDASVQVKSPRTFATLHELRLAFPAHLERVHVRATGILADLRDQCAPGETTFLPSIWRYLAIFDEERPCDVVHMSDIDSAPFIPFSPPGVAWEREKRFPVISATTHAFVPAYCGIGIVLTRHDLTDACAMAGISSFQRVPTTSSVSLVPVEAWHRMMRIVVDAHFRAFLTRVYDDDARLLKQVAASPEYAELVRSVLSGAKSCDDPDLLEPLRRVMSFPSPEHVDAVRKSMQYVRLILLPICDGSSRVPADFRSTFKNAKIMDDAGIILRFEYGIDELLFHGLFEWFGRDRVQIIADQQGGRLYLSRMKEAPAVLGVVRKVSDAVMSFVHLLHIPQFTYTDYEVTFAELWVRIMVFSLKDADVAWRMADAHYLMFADVLTPAGIARPEFVTLTRRLATQNNFAKTAAKRMFPSASASLRDQNGLHVWNVLFTRFMTKWMLAWVYLPQLNPFYSTGMV